MCLWSYFRRRAIAGRLAFRSFLSFTAASDAIVRRTYVHCHSRSRATRLLECTSPSRSVCIVQPFRLRSPHLYLCSYYTTTLTACAHALYYTHSSTHSVICSLISMLSVHLLEAISQLSWIMIMDYDYGFCVLFI